MITDGTTATIILILIVAVFVYFFLRGIRGDIHPVKEKPVQIKSNPVYVPRHFTDHQSSNPTEQAEFTLEEYEALDCARKAYDKAINDFMRMNRGNNSTESIDNFRETLGTNPYSKREWIVEYRKMKGEL